MVIENITNGCIIFQEDMPVSIDSSEVEIENYIKKQEENVREFYKEKSNRIF